MASPVQVRHEDGARAIATLVLAFAADPVERFLYPEAGRYLSHFPSFLAVFGGPAFEGQTVWQTSGLRAVALWLPPGTEPDGERIVAGQAQAGDCPPVSLMLRPPP